MRFSGVFKPDLSLEVNMTVLLCALLWSPLQDVWHLLPRGLRKAGEPDQGLADYSQLSICRREVLVWGQTQLNQLIHHYIKFNNGLGVKQTGLMSGIPIFNINFELERDCTQTSSNITYINKYIFLDSEV